MLDIVVSKRDMEETKTDMVPGPMELINYYFLPFKLCRELHANIPPGRETRMIANFSHQAVMSLRKELQRMHWLVLPGTCCGGTMVRNLEALRVSFFISDIMKVDLMPLSTLIIVVIIIAPIIAANIY